MTRFRAYARYLLPYRWQLALGVACALVYGVSSGFGVPFFFGKVFSAFFEGDGEFYGLGPLGAALLLPGIFLLRGVSGYLNQYAFNYCGQQVLRGVRQDLFNQLQGLPVSYFEKNPSGDLISRLITDTTIVQAAILNVANEFIRQPIQMVGALGYLAFLSWQFQEAVFILLFFSAIPISFIPLRLIGRHLKKRGREAQEAMSLVTRQISEDLEAVTEIRSYNLEEREKLRFADRLRHYLRVQMKLVKYAAATQPLMEWVGAGVLSVAFYYAYQKGIPASVFLAMGTALYFCVDPLKRLLKLQNDIQRSQGAFERIDQILQAENAGADPDHPQLPQTIRGAIRFHRVSFSYADIPALREIDLAIEPGTVCALVGPSGAGKSTLVKLLNRLHDPVSGQIEMDGVDLRRFRLRDLRALVALVPQNPVLFDDTVTANIAVGNPDAGMEAIVAAARAAEAHDFISALPQGYDSPLGENATRLSGGQRQRIALARAFLRDAPILILDEATSALDSESETRIQVALKRLVQGKTVFIVAHRLSTIKKAHRILVLDGGRVVGDGTHQQLLESSPLYRSLCQKQGLADQRDRQAETI